MKMICPTPIFIGESKGPPHIRPSALAPTESRGHVLGQNIVPFPWLLTRGFYRHILYPGPDPDGLDVHKFLYAE